MKSPAFCIYSGGEFRTYRVKEQAALDRLMPKEHSKEWNSLTVSVVHEALLNPAMGEQDRAEREGRIAYTSEALEAIGMVETGAWQIAILVPPVPLELLRRVADNGERMPQKSTFFYPKLPTGLVLNPIDGKI